MTDNIHQSIEKLTGSEAKSLLFTMMYRLNNIRELKDRKEEMMEELYFLYDEVLRELQNHKPWERNYTTVHIVCGESPAGSLKFGLDHENKVIGFPDMFAEGPIWELHNETGRRYRYEWLLEHLNIEMDYLEEEYVNKMMRTLEEIRAIPEQMPIVLWTAENAHEQTGLRYLIYLLKEKKNPLFLINSTVAYQELFNTDEYQYFYHHTGEVEPGKLNQIYQMKKSSPLTWEERNRFAEEWTILSKSKEVLRKWIKQQIEAVSEDYYDQLIIDAARKWHRKKGKMEFMKAARLIGEVLGQMEGNVSDAFLEYRVRSLIYNRIFEIKGIPKTMRHYSVRLN
ncbi:DUF1835 domain-containing protein [Neobacillus mesonae]|uniref:DUF1835 domain-containing protein n=1 Tax=Neobacillus mesonae TaxID=1193713 RepID=UPI00203F2A01|nr:DUF1835 domain-containing protein [Neobacillus mesonae]MCM3571079.1 DUF1835 domain-containing protein [Neobacillus mesonae]